MLDLSVKDTPCCPNHIELCTKLLASELGPPFCEGQTAHPSGIH